MIYKLNFHEERIKKITTAVKLTQRQASKVIQIDSDHLKEKNNWYLVANVLNYFKARKDCRLLGEFLSKDILKQFGRDTADYRLVRLVLGKVEKIGLLSPNIQNPDYSYYDVSNLYRLYPEMPRRYGQYTIRGLLETIKNNDVLGKEKLIQDIVTTYVLDWFCHQLDRNPKNLLFEKDENGTLQLATLIDNESSFAINTSGAIDSEHNPIWIPAIPYEELSFASSPDTAWGCDYNIFGVLVDYPEIVVPILKRLTDTNFDQVITQYRDTLNSKMYLEDNGVSFLRNFVYKKQGESEKLLKLV